MRNDLVRKAGARPIWALGLGAVALLIAGCNSVGGPQMTFWDVVWSMVVFFFWFMLIWIFIAIFGDIFRRNDLSGGSKAIWILALVVLPFLGALIYMVMRPKVTAQDVQMMAKSEAATAAVSTVSTADELAKLNQLKAAGAINDAEYEQLKAKLMS
ncbi:MAG TPA: SHOCT domain-containing protein [Candidatus Limnocylindrales bacterium]|nr:SHOCT domain-containing protein [Candidatus Limnocylindrales bacterium]